MGGEEEEFIREKQKTQENTVIANKKVGGGQAKCEIQRVLREEVGGTVKV